jgi:VWFA-related protein
VFATVHDKGGKIVQNLTKDDFVLTDDGRPQAIKYFARQSDLPLTLGLLVDTSMSMTNVLEEERTASYKFFQKVMREDKDQAFVIHFDKEVELLRDLTSSRKELEKSLRELQTPELRRRDPSDPDAGPRRARNIGTALYDAILLGSDELMKKQTGRKAIILLSDGDDFGSRTSLASAIESAQRADTLVYAIRMADPGFGAAPQRGRAGPRGGIPFPRGGRGGSGRGPAGPRPDGKKVMERIARETGGAFFDVTKKDNLDKIFARIEEELRNQYSLGFTPDKPGPDGEYRKLLLTVPKQKTLVVQTRDGYYSSATRK